MTGFLNLAAFGASDELTDNHDIFSVLCSDPSFFTVRQNMSSVLHVGSGGVRVIHLFSDIYDIHVSKIEITNLSIMRKEFSRNVLLHVSLIKSIRHDALSLRVCKSFSKSICKSYVKVLGV